MTGEELRFPEKVFDVRKRLISVDAPDGSGKSSFVEALADKLRAVTGEKVRIIQPGKINDSDVDLLASLEQEQELTRRRNSVWMATMARNYSSVIRPVLDNGEWVIEDSSEVRALAMSLLVDGGVPGKATESAFRWLKSGRLTAGLLPNTRINLVTSPQECVERVTQREGRPSNLGQMEKLFSAYRDAWEIIRTFQTTTEERFIDVRLEKQIKENLYDYLGGVIKTRVLGLILR